MAFFLVICPAAGWTSDIVHLKAGGTGAFLGTMKHLADAFMRSHPGVKIHVLPSLGSGGGIKALIAGDIDLALSGRPLTNDESARGVAATEVGKSALVFAVSRSNGASDLSLDRLIAIYDGKIVTWPDGVSIRLVLRPASDIDTILLKGISSGMREAVSQALSRKGMNIAATDQENADALMSIPGALGAITEAQILTERLPLKVLSIDGSLPSRKALATGAYQHAKTLYLVTNQEQSPAARQFVDFLRSRQGRDILTRAGLVVAAP